MPLHHGAQALAMLEAVRALLADASAPVAVAVGAPTDPQGAEASATLTPLRDGAVTVREGGDATSAPPRVVGVVLEMLVSTGPASSPAALSALVDLRAAVFDNPVLPETLTRPQGRLRIADPSATDLAALWSVLGGSWRPAFLLRVEYAPTAPRPLLDGIRDVLGEPGLVLVPRAAGGWLERADGAGVRVVDLGAVVSEHAEDTADHLARVLEEAERAGEVVVLDEADALLADAAGEQALRRDGAVLDVLAAHAGSVVLAAERPSDALVARVRRVLEP